MKKCPTPSAPSFLFLCVAVGLTLFQAVSIQAAGRKNPTSKVFVAEVKGEAQIDTGEKIEPLTVQSVYSAEGATIETKAESSNVLVFSNGSSLIAGPNSRFEVKRFLQEPFTPNRNDLDVEPSISQTTVRISHGSVGLCTSRLVAGSSMTYLTPHGTINIRGRKVMIEVADNETLVTLIEGDVTVISSGAGGSQPLKPGQQAVLSSAAPGQPSVITVHTLSSDASTKADDQVSLACMARRTVYFDTPDQESAEIKVVPIQPSDLPTQFTVSPSRTN